jgi:hypothetical protein
MVKVTMNLSDADVAAVETIQKAVNARSKAQAVSFALAATRYIVTALMEDAGKQLLVRSRNGTLDSIILPELEAARAATAA